MRKLPTKVRAYGWYCPHCKEHKDIDKVSVVKVTQSRYMAMICTDCTTEVVDCFLVKQQIIKLDCDRCADRFRCLTRADAVVEKGLQNVKTHEIRSVPNVVDPRNIEGVRTYTGIYNRKLDSEFCAYEEREDCNHSWMRSGYDGVPYRRCIYMKYRATEKEWYCWYGKSKRGVV